MAFAGVALYKWLDLLSIVAATVAAIAIVDHGRWPLGLAAAPRVAARELLAGGLVAAVLIVVADRLIVLTSFVRHSRGTGFPWTELVLVFLPAAVHEELLFRGYVYQKLRTWSRFGAVAVTASVFAALHGGNAGVTPVAMVNLVLAGVLLALAYERWQRLWFPIGIHLGWNVVSGPVLGYGVSGYIAGKTVFTTTALGPPWITGGLFGIEGSLWMIAIEALAIAALFRSNSA
jgi:membrane protease YdiL (CAAX protease family)